MYRPGDPFLWWGCVGIMALNCAICAIMPRYIPACLISMPGYFMIYAVSLEPIKKCINYVFLDERPETLLHDPDLDGYPDFQCRRIPGVASASWIWTLFKGYKNFLDPVIVWLMLSQLVVLAMIVAVVVAMFRS